MRKVAVAVIVRDHRVLICQRKRGSRYELKWEFPGGKVEPGEALEACVRRELREELSIEAGTVDHVETERSHYADGGLFEVSFFYFDSLIGTLVNNVFEQVQWVTDDELTRLDILEGNKSIVARLIRGPLNSSHEE